MKQRSTASECPRGGEGGNSMEILGADLKPGDVIEVWWKPGRDTIMCLAPYQGAYRDRPGWEGVVVAEFAMLNSGMTIFPGETFIRLAEGGTEGK